MYSTSVLKEIHWQIIYPAIGSLNQWTSGLYAGLNTFGCLRSSRVKSDDPHFSVPARKKCGTQYKDLQCRSTSI